MKNALEDYFASRPPQPFPAAPYELDENNNPAGCLIPDSELPFRWRVTPEGNLSIDIPQLKVDV